MSQQTYQISRDQTETHQQLAELVAFQGHPQQQENRNASDWVRDLFQSFGNALQNPASFIPSSFNVAQVLAQLPVAPQLDLSEVIQHLADQEIVDPIHFQLQPPIHLVNFQPPQFHPGQIWGGHRFYPLDQWEPLAKEPALLPWSYRALLGAAKSDWLCPSQSETRATSLRSVQDPEQLKELDLMNATDRVERFAPVKRPLRAVARVVYYLGVTTIVTPSSIAYFGACAGFFALRCQGRKLFSTSSVKERLCKSDREEASRHWQVCKQELKFIIGNLSVQGLILGFVRLATLATPLAPLGTVALIAQGLFLHQVAFNFEHHCFDTCFSNVAGKNPLLGLMLRREFGLVRSDGQLLLDHRHRASNSQEADAVFQEVYRQWACRALGENRGIAQEHTLDVEWKDADFMQNWDPALEKVLEAVRDSELSEIEKQEIRQTFEALDLRRRRLLQFWQGPVYGLDRLRGKVGKPKVDNTILNAAESKAIGVFSWELDGTQIVYPHPRLHGITCRVEAKFDDTGEVSTAQIRELKDYHRFQKRHQLRQSFLGTAPKGTCPATPLQEPVDIVDELKQFCDEAGDRLSQLQVQAVKRMAAVVKSEKGLNFFSEADHQTLHNIFQHLMLRLQEEESLDAKVTALQLIADMTHGNPATPWCGPGCLRYAKRIRSILNTRDGSPMEEGFLAEVRKMAQEHKQKVPDAIASEANEEHDVHFVGYIIQAAEEEGIAFPPEIATDLQDHLLIERARERFGLPPEVAQKVKAHLQDEIPFILRDHFNQVMVAQLQAESWPVDQDVCGPVLAQLRLFLKSKGYTVPASEEILDQHEDLVAIEYDELDTPVKIRLTLKGAAVLAEQAGIFTT